LFVAETGAQTRTHAEAPVAGVAGRYASALFELARDTRALDQVAAELDTFDRMLADSPDLQRLVRSPVFSAEEQQKAVGAILDRADLTGIAANFIRLVASKRRLFALPDMMRSFAPASPPTRASCPPRCGSPSRPPSAFSPTSRPALRDVARAEVDLDVKIDPALIGGLVVRMGGRMVDASLRTRLNGIRLAMREAR
jgi:F-type H+-transporting ATPase subunit delta